jgi:hypothetical protein
MTGCIARSVLFFVACLFGCGSNPEFAGGQGGGTEIPNGVIGFVQNAGEFSGNTLYAELTEISYKPQVSVAGSVIEPEPTLTPVRIDSIGTDGLFAFDSVMPGAYTLFVLSRDGTRGYARQGLVLHTPDTAVNLGAIRTEPTGSIIGNIVLGDTAIIPGADVYIKGSPFCTTSDKEGRFALSGIPRGSFKVSFWKEWVISAPGIPGSTRNDTLRAESGPVEMTPGIAVPITLRH